ncbi:hypothetical protein Flexsi_1155 [Flexistipes sinusarabici DSM 4947]|uniref:Uncharacterized protein n=2 Tax=Flexistipes sinusarabici TaxID=2352 RepID=F8E6H4_FLESM|nr:hypothetical protein [Flexistipes sinusarabici]AEI14811.1 hypothetical protein Flexsi_1155 [Flexistipes sinusarabici DSM 4947]HCW92865.1 hypothetical protein [Flexistipes sinusarabici]
MEKREVVIQEFREFCKSNSKKNYRGGSFRPFKYYKHKDGANEPVYFIGGPGLSVAFFTTLVVALAFVLLSGSFSFWYWLLFFIIVIPGLRIAMKIDKANQIRSMVASLGEHAITLIEQSENSETKEEELKMLEKSREFLQEALKWVHEPMFEKQLENLEVYIKEKAPE